MRDPHDDRPVYPIRVAQQLTGLTARQLRYLEAQGIVLPHRTSGGQRLYSERDLARIRQTRALMDEGLQLGEIQRRLARPTPERRPSPADFKQRDTEPDQPAAEVPRRLTSLYPLRNRDELLKLLREGR